MWKCAIPILCLAWTAAAQLPRPDLAISVNGSANATATAGWPILVRGMVMHSQRLSRAATVAPLRLAPAGMAWPDAIQIVVTGVNGEQQGWNFRLARPPEQPELLLPHRMWTQVLWYLSPDASAQLQPGPYRIQARLTIRDSEGWNGSVESKAATLRITEAGASSGEVSSQGMILRAQYYAGIGQTNEAASALDQLLKSGSRSLPALTLQARLAEDAGETGLALLFASMALNLYLEQQPRPKEQAKELMYLRNRLLDKLLAAPE